MNGPRHWRVRSSLPSSLTGSPAHRHFPNTNPASNLDRISTQWSQLDNPEHFLMRYAPALRSYLMALLQDPHDADEVAQEFLLRVVEQGFVRADPGRGRFRDYLKTAIRNAALTVLRRKKGIPLEHVEQGLADHTAEQAEAEWLATWRQCLLDKAWRGLESYQHRHPGNWAFTVLKSVVDRPQEDSTALAAHVSTVIGQSLRPEAFRKQLSRARHRFAELLVQEIAETLDPPTPEEIETELGELGLLEYVKDFLPPDWRTQGKLKEAE
jgi:RNA polymerase sigma factor (sigma-70 family)